MSSEIRAGGEPGRTLGTLVRLFTVVEPYVALHVRQMREAFPALRTDVWPIAPVQPLVHDHRALLMETLRTHATLEALRCDVRVEVPVQRRSMLKQPVAVSKGTLERFRIVQVRLLVCRLRVRTVELSVTVAAHERINLPRQHTPELDCIGVISPNPRR